MKRNNGLTFIFILLLIGCSSNQLNNSLLDKLTLSWANIGNKHSFNKSISTLIDSFFVAPPTGNPSIDHNNITRKILEASNKRGFNTIILQQGTYKISKPLVFSFGMDSVVVKGSKNSEIKFIGKSDKAADIIKVIGKPSNWRTPSKIIAYDDSTQTIKLNKLLSKTNVGDFIEIRIPNGSWHDSKNHKSWNPKNYLGTIVRVQKIDKKNKSYSVEHSLSTEWELSSKDKLAPKVVKYNPIKGIGIESLKLSTNNKNNRQGFNINFSYAANCWVDNIESAYAASVHINIGNSTSIEVRNSTMHHAKDYGNPANPEKKLIAGTGYGVNVARSSNCLIENNTFYHLRHAMLIALGSNRNVFGYNHSYDQYSYPVKNLSDLNLHGHYPYNNLFEGNVVERIHADQWWGSNGPNNTFVNNTVKDGVIKLEKTNDALIINNKAELKLIDSRIKIDTTITSQSEESISNETGIESSETGISFYKSKKK